MAYKCMLSTDTLALELFADSLDNILVKVYYNYTDIGHTLHVVGCGEGKRASRMHLREAAMGAVLHWELGAGCMCEKHKHETETPTPTTMASGKSGSRKIADGDVS